MDTLIGINKRLAALQESEKEFTSAGAREQKEFQQTLDSCRQSLEAMKQQISLLKSEAAAIQENFRGSIKELRRTVSNADLEVLKRKMSKYSRENLVAVSEFLKMVEKEL